MQICGFTRQDTAVTGLHEVRVDVPSPYKVIGGGALVMWNGETPGQYLISSFPDGNAAWVGRASDHKIVDPVALRTYAIAINDPNDEWDVRVFSAASAPTSRPDVSVAVESGYTMTCGGAQLDYAGQPEKQILTATYPTSAESWRAMSRDHQGPGVSAILTVYAIGIRGRRGRAFPSVLMSQATSGVAAHPSAAIDVPLPPPAYCVIGGGAFIEQNGHDKGNLLVAATPQPWRQWYARGKDHSVSDHARITAYSLAIVGQANGDCLEF